MFQVDQVNMTIRLLPDEEGSCLIFSTRKHRCEFFASDFVTCFPLDNYSLCQHIKQIILIWFKFIYFLINIQNVLIVHMLKNVIATIEWNIILDCGSLIKDLSPTVNLWFILYFPLIWIIFWIYNTKKCCIFACYIKRIFF